jgi:N-acetylglutamate synthase-like GNAT family acetyltransferase
MNKHYQISEGNCLISTNPSKLDVDVIHHFLSQESYWAKGIPRNVVERAIANSICFGVYYNNVQAGFARVITDKATFAYLADVFILTEYRGSGLGKLLMQTIHAHPELQGFRRWLLATKDAHGLYEQFGWTSITDDIIKRFMHILNPDVYKQSDKKFPAIMWRQ